MGWRKEVEENKEEGSEWCLRILSSRQRKKTTIANGHLSMYSNRCYGEERGRRGARSNLHLNAKAAIIAASSQLVWSFIFQISRS